MEDVDSSTLPGSLIGLAGPSSQWIAALAWRPMEVAQIACSNSIWFHKLCATLWIETACPTQIILENRPTDTLWISSCGMLFAGKSGAKLWIAFILGALR